MRDGEQCTGCKKATIRGHARRRGYCNAMSQENVEVVRAAFEAWNAGDMDALRELLDPGIIWQPPEGWPEPGPFAGREAVMRWLEQLREVWPTYVTELIGDIVEAADRVAVRQVWSGAGHGPDLNMESTGVFTVRKGRILGVKQFWDHAEALEAVGLSE
jgi:ketosteroid isomerase-like protein